jgi:molybdopterin molybdotransferase
VDEAAVLRVAVLPGQESFKIRPLLDANCWAIVPADAASVAAGDLVSLAPLGPGGLAL